MKEFYSCCRFGNGLYDRFSLMNLSLFVLLLIEHHHHPKFVVTAAKKIVQIASPLQSLTIWDPEVKELKQTRRELFLKKFRAGLQAEVEAWKVLLEEQVANGGDANNLGSIDPNNPNWAKLAAASDRNLYKSNEQFVERAYDKAVAEVEKEIAAQQEAIKLKHKKLQQKKRGKQATKYQFVGVINPPKTFSTTTKPPITWYARKKPEHSKWTVRLVHVNRNAILKDLYDRNIIDIFAKYTNTGEVNSETNQPIVVSHYSVRKKSWMNLWNFSPKHLITDSSGSYWRERRLPSGLYTDGNSVYEASYRYRDGRNGMHKISSFGQFLNSKSVEKTKKEKILKRLAADAPDVVLED